MHNVEIHKVRRLVFDNLPKVYTVPLKGYPKGTSLCTCHGYLLLKEGSLSFVKEENHEDLQSLPVKITLKNPNRTDSAGNFTTLSMNNDVCLCLRIAQFVSLPTVIAIKHIPLHVNSK